MPELPEVEITKKKLEKQGIVGAKISGFWSDWPRALQIAKSQSAIDRDIKGRKILALRRIGKALFFDLNDRPFNKAQGKTLRILGWHFRMSGRLEVRSGKLEVGGEKLKVRSGQLEVRDKTIHAKVFLTDGREIAFRDPRKFGIIWYGTSEELKKDSYIGSLGPDVLSIKFAEFKNRIKNKSGAVKAILLN